VLSRIRQTLSMEESEHKLARMSELPTRFGVDACRHQPAHAGNRAEMAPLGEPDLHAIDASE
jgi:hypothetical protein